MLSSPLKTSHLPNLIFDERMASALPVLSVDCSWSTARLDIITTQDKGRRLVLITNFKRVLQPVIDIRATLERVRQVQELLAWEETYQRCSQKVDPHVVKPSDVQDGVHIKCSRIENDTVMVDATLERIEDSGRILRLIRTARLDDASLSDTKPSEEAQGHDNLHLYPRIGLWGEPLRRCAGKVASGGQLWISHP